MNMTLKAAFFSAVFFAGGVASVGLSNPANAMTLSLADARPQSTETTAELPIEMVSQRRGGNRGYRYGRGGGNRGYRYGRGGGNRAYRHGGGRRHYGYNRGRHGARYGYRHGNYRHYYGGYWYAFPWWLGAAAVAAPYYYEPEYNGGDHVQWCLDRYRSYNPRTDTFRGYDGFDHRCISPYS
jgi:hypothetical protein